MPRETGLNVSLTETSVMFTEPVPVLVTVTVFVRPDASGSRLPKSSVVGSGVMAPTRVCVPVPVRVNGEVFTGSLRG